MRESGLQKANTVAVSKQKNVVRNAKPQKSILECFEHIVELAEDSNLDSDFFDTASTHIKYAARKLNLTPMQVVLLSIFVDRSEDSRIMISEIAKYAGCRTTRILRLSDDIDVLESNHYIRASRSRNSLSYRVPSEVLDALRKNQPYVHVSEPVPDTQAFFDRFDQLINEKDDDELTNESLMQQTMELLHEIRETEFAKRLGNYNLEKDMSLLFIFMAHLYVENSDDHIMFHNIDDIYDNEKIPSYIKSSFRNRSLPLFRYKLIENINEDGMARSDAFKLTDMAKEELLCELNLNNVGNPTKGSSKPTPLLRKA